MARSVIQRRPVTHHVASLAPLSRDKTTAREATPRNHFDLSERAYTRNRFAV
jgi:hypothetical protein